jgi:hypothetical protein
MGKFNWLSGQVVPKMGMNMDGGFNQLSGWVMSKMG